MYNPITISNYFLKNFRRESDITPMKLVKLVYIAHGWYLGITGNALIDENPEAWKYGPVIPRIYHHFKSFKSSPIKINEDGFSKDPNTFLPKDIQSFLDKIWEVYGGYSGIELSAKTHEMGTPWYITWNKLEEQKSKSPGFGIFSYQISDNLIKEYYKDKLLVNKTTSLA